MNTRNRIITLALLLVVTLLGAACTPRVVQINPTKAPDLAVTASVLRTEVANTVVTGMTATVEALPTSTSTSTETAVPPTATSTLAIPTAVMPTPPPTVTPGRVIVTVWPGFTSTPSEWQCAITKQSLPYGMQVKAGADGDAKWTVKNTGTEDWGAGALQYEYRSGTKMQKFNDAYKVGKTIKTGKTLDIVLDIIVPKEPGFYRMEWALVYGDTTLCYLPVNIWVQ